MPVFSGEMDAGDPLSFTKMSILRAYHDSCVRVETHMMVCKERCMEWNNIEAGATLLFNL